MVTTASRVAIASLGVAAAMLLAPIASAQAPEEASAPATDDELEARQIFEAGRQAFVEGRFENALVLFQRSYDLSGRSVLLFNIASCHDRLRQDEQALAAFRRYLEELPDAPNRDEVTGRIAELEAAIERNRLLAAQASAPTIVVEDRTPVYGTWWFWTVVGAVVVGGTIAAILLLSEDSLEEPIVGNTGLTAALRWP
jgi:tetratricopeptide (TPR) repeat protein